MIPFGLSSLMTVSMPIARRTTKCFVPGASAIYLCNEGAGTTLTDYSGNGNDGTLGGGSNAPAWAGGGLTFQSDDFASVPAFRAMSGDRTQMSAIIVFSQPTFDGTRCVITHYQGSANRRSWYILTTAGGAVSINLSDDGTTGAGHFKGYMTPDNSIAAATPICFGFTFDSGALTLYVDGAPVVPTKTTDGAITTIYNNQVDPVYLGNNVGLQMAPAGLLINAAITYPYALTPTQMAQVHAYLKATLAPRGVILA